MSNLEDQYSKQFADSHESGLKGLFYIYEPFKSLVRSRIFYLSFAISTVFLIYVINQKIDELRFFNSLTDLGLAILPAIAGFNLAAYSLALTLILGNPKVLKSVIDLTKIFEEKQRGTFYQKISASFAWSVLVQSASVILFFISDLFNPLSLPFPPRIISAGNHALLFLLVLIAAYSILLVAQVVLNLFTFSQSLHSELAIEALEEEIEKNKHDPEK